MTDEQLRADVERLAHKVASLESAVAQIAGHMFGHQVDGLLAALTGDREQEFRRLYLNDEVAAEQPRIPPRPIDDVLPRGGRNPRIGCQRYDSGTWVHGRPPDCPRWARQ